MYAGFNLLILSPRIRSDTGGLILVQGFTIDEFGREEAWGLVKHLPRSIGVDVSYRTERSDRSRGSGVTKTDQEYEEVK